MKLSGIFLLIIFLITVNKAEAYHYYQNNEINSPDSINTTQMDSLLKIIPDSVKQLQDSLKLADSDSLSNVTSDSLLPSNFPILEHGKVFVLNNKPALTIGKRDYSFDQYAGLYEIINKKANVFPLSLGSYSQFNSFSFYGATPRDLSVTFNYRPMNDFQYSSYNIEQFSPEFIENLEILTGSDAAIFSDNSAGAMINIQEVRYDTKKPFTRMLFAQAGNEAIFADGIFSQNFKRNFNLTFGFKSMNGKGEYDNNEFETWNLRALLRWNPSDRTSISLSEIFNNHSMGVNGGIDSATSYYQYANYFSTGEPFNIAEGNYAAVMYGAMLEKQFRHDITLSFTSILDEDSTHSASGALFFTHADWDRSSSQGFFNDTIEGFSDKYIYKMAGANLKYELAIANSLFINTGGEIYYIDNEKSIFTESFEGMSMSAFGRGRINVFDIVDVSGGLRFRQLKDNTAVSAGAKARINFTGDFSITADFSRTVRLPSPSEGLSLSSESSLLAIIEAEYKSEIFKCKLNVFRREINNPILFRPVYNDTNETNLVVNTEAYNADKRTILGGGIALTYIPFGEISLDPYLWLPANISFFGQSYQSELDGADDKRFPEYYAGIDFYSRIKINQSIARIGVEYAVLGPFNGEVFIPQTRSYIPNNFDNGIMNNGLNIYAKARLGNAFIRVSFENILSQPYYYTAVYPNYGMNFRFMVTWSFFD